MSKIIFNNIKSNEVEEKTKFINELEKVVEQFGQDYVITYHSGEERIEIQLLGKEEDNE